MLLPAEVDSIPEKRGRKRNSVASGSFIGGKIVLILLAEVITFHVGPTAVDVQGLGPELISRSTL